MWSSYSVTGTFNKQVLNERKREFKDFTPNTSKTVKFWHNDPIYFGLSGLVVLQKLELKVDYINLYFVYELH